MPIFIFQGVCCAAAAATAVAVVAVTPLPQPPPRFRFDQAQATSSLSLSQRAIPRLASAGDAAESSAMLLRRCFGKQVGETTSTVRSNGVIFFRTLQQRSQFARDREPFSKRFLRGS